MTNTVAHRLSFVALLTAGSLSGCVIAKTPPAPSTIADTTPAGSAVLLTAWTVGGQPAAQGCAAQGLSTVIVSVLDATKSKVLGKGSTVCSAGQISVGGLPNASGAWVQVDGYKATDPQGKPSWGNDPVDGPFNFAAGKSTQIGGGVDLVQLGSAAPAGVGNVYVTWTILGQAPATACGGSGITSVKVRVLDENKADLASVEVPCNLGNATVAQVPAGTTRYVQIDAIGPKLPQSWGNIDLSTPFSVQKDLRSVAPKAIDLGKRSVLSFDWQVKGGSCASLGVATVYTQVRNSNGQVIVPTSDAWAAKPCTLDASSSYDARVIDYAHAQPSCAIPPGARGLVICNAPAPGVKLQLVGVPSNSMTGVIGGSMEVQNFEAGTQLDILEPIVLSPCGGANACIQP